MSMQTLTITHLNPGTPDHVRAVLQGKHPGKRIEIKEYQVVYEVLQEN